MTVTETFFALHVGDMQRATAFYVRAFGATVMAASPRWSSLQIAGVRVGLFHEPAHAGARTGLHFVVTDLVAACADVEREGGRVIAPAIEAAPGVTIADVVDTEGNGLTLRS